MPKQKISSGFKIVLVLAFVAIVAYLIFKPKKEELPTIGEVAIEEKVDTTTTLFKYNNILFSLPSPYQISLLMEKSGMSYNKALLNSTKKASDYVSNFSKAVNFGVYGSDLGYINIYRQTQDAASYFAVVKILSQDIGLYNALDKPTIKRIENNIENRDSLLVIISNTYRKIDNYLKSNNRDNTGALILAGGWVESLYILTQQLKDENNNELLLRIAEQKRPLDNLIKLLVPYSNDSKDNYWLVENLIELAYAFDEIEEKYTYIPPKTNSRKKFTLIKSKSDFIVQDNQIQKITDKIALIREQLIK
jgi:hypothetical protein